MTAAGIGKCSKVRLAMFYTQKDEDGKADNEFSIKKPIRKKEVTPYWKSLGQLVYIVAGVGFRLSFSLSCREVEVFK
jgi:hypothetical protein